MPLPEVLVVVTRREQLMMMHWAQLPLIDNTGHVSVPLLCQFYVDPGLADTKVPRHVTNAVRAAHARHRPRGRATVWVIKRQPLCCADI
mmetsp:Transcript_27210/g.54765  ORF Transcript_27210/g.54765 Transcript_27210/m.54765 type:complete len:89 (-) Transcript_27210:75-341(-)